MHSEKRFYLLQNGKTSGPFSQLELQRMHSDRAINRSTPCKEGDTGRWLTVYDLVPMALRGHIIDEPLEIKASRRWAFLLLAILCLISALAIGLLLFAPFFSAYMAPLSPTHPNDMSSANSRMAAVITGIFVLHFFMVVMLPVVGLFLFAFWIWMLVSALKNEPAGEDRIVWILVIILTGPIGAFIYAFMRYRSRPSPLSS